MTTETVIPKKRTLGLVGIFAGFLALAAAFLSPYIKEAIDPPAKPIEETAVDFAGRIMAAAKAKTKGETYVPTAVSEPLPSRFLFPGIIGLGMLAAGFGVLSLIKAEPKMIGAGAIALGLSAAVVQWSLMIVGAILFLLIVFAVMSFFEG